ncbi:uncharacterized protein LAESUDRAFT_368973 [Laetiporus sulphureus 93-53]|uniref:Uncharacterized protein n=1 Tax=Laetiporus sulphureus 93-53 TaxID=1314785 RepID=A0A165CU06_9APHY|nr:uncharacterized protein LAESUDRAFT_368973 [Laetiporus sulphureus 93-53]KZT03431.1 hypothetical protein LAESUDRAFT_368973 [Laetiporus sulphureus 93-53]
MATLASLPPHATRDSHLTYIADLSHCSRPLHAPLDAYRHIPRHTACTSATSTMSLCGPMGALTDGGPWAPLSRALPGDLGSAGIGWRRAAWLRRPRSREAFRSPAASGRLASAVRTSKPTASYQTLRVFSHGLRGRTTAGGSRCLPCGRRPECRARNVVRHTSIYRSRADVDAGGICSALTTRRTRIWHGPRQTDPV